MCPNFSVFEAHHLFQSLQQESVKIRSTVVKHHISYFIRACAVVLSRVSEGELGLENYVLSMGRHCRRGRATKYPSNFLFRKSEGVVIKKILVHFCERHNYQAISLVVFLLFFSFLPLIKLLDNYLQTQQIS